MYWKTSSENKGVVATNEYTITSHYFVAGEPAISLLGGSSLSLLRSATILLIIDSPARIFILVVVVVLDVIVAGFDSIETTGTRSTRLAAAKLANGDAHGAAAAVTCGFGTRIL
jgi:hypothetical protein